MLRARKVKERIAKINSLEDNEVEVHPIIVHCKAGVGRTGTLIACYNLIEGLLM